MSDNFRQTVEEILSFTECEDDGRICSDMTLDKYEERPSCEQCRTDRICEAVLKMADELGNEKIKSSKPLGNMEIGFNQGVQNCQVWLRKQVE